MSHKPIDADKLIADLRNLKKRATAMGVDQQKALGIIQQAIDRAKAIHDAKERGQESAAQLRAPSRTE